MSQNESRKAEMNLMISTELIHNLIKSKDWKKVGLSFKAVLLKLFPPCPGFHAPRGGWGEGDIVYVHKNTVMILLVAMLT